jgi:predicted amidophosphoribosyltransferase
MNPAELRAALQAGKLEQTCPDCGRWSAATAYCSRCFRPMTEADYYRNGNTAERSARMPHKATQSAVAPRNP